ncbi:MAG: alanyl-tRNA editing protein, partial [Anaerolineales bacterium]|nr:alanyl-tRNA editing protein [Anaerolineales bacterium]
MSERLYYTDAYTTRFDARVVEIIPQGQQTAVVLNQSYFYPASGGQPADSGYLNGVPVSDVVIRPEDDAVLHLLAADTFTAATVQAEVSWTRRFDHMQQHTGQHILSRAFLEIAAAETLSFHLSDNIVTIDIDRTDISAAELMAVEALANEVVWRNGPIQITFVSQDEIENLALRKRPPIKEGQKLRLIDIDGFDLTACGGTHVGRAGEVGLIKIVNQQRRGNKLRIEFYCGGRAVRDYETKNEIVQALMSEMTTSGDQLLAAVQKLKEERHQTQKILKKAQTELSQYEIAALIKEAEKVHGINLVTQAVADKTVNELRLLATQLTSEPQTIALTGVCGEKAMLIFKRSDEL